MKKKYPKIKKIYIYIYMKTRRIEVIKPIIEDKTANQVNLGCSGKNGSPLIIEIDLQVTKLCLRLFDVQKIFFSKNHFHSLNSH